MKSESSYMDLALKLAAKANHRTLPNPMVGAVLVNHGKIVGQAFHPLAGKPHAEVLALRQAGKKARGATLYVTLEPCAHTGRTGPCTEAIIKAGIRRVVAAMRDPNPRNNGKGERRLKSKGIPVRVGVLEDQARALNEIFITRMTRQRPFVTVKVAQSLDGKIATRTGDSFWVSSSKAREWSHKRLRQETDALLIGVETVLKDNPRLKIRGLRVIADSRLRTPPRARLFASLAPVLIATTRSASRQAQGRLEKAGAQVLRLPSFQGQVDLKSLLKHLARQEISRLLIEGGGEVIASALAQKLVDRVAWIIAPKIIGGRGAVASVGGLGPASLSASIHIKQMQLRRLGPDLLVTGRVG